MIRRIEIERFSLTSTKPSDELLGAIHVMERRYATLLQQTEIVKSGGGVQLFAAPQVVSFELATH